jgi:hypothetical protein
LQLLVVLVFHQVLQDLLLQEVVAAVELVIHQHREQQVGQVVEVLEQVVEMEQMEQIILVVEVVVHKVVI